MMIQLGQEGACVLRVLSLQKLKILVINRLRVEV